ncbi:MAG: amino acid ABC transporter permease [Desulfobacterales bacterium]|nr:amino acid ABC transporter permease [Desulfobacterales bacterium]MCP4162088.1 amino acid ABC transporter permease [Deltaproteobacteria bacterium]
MDSVSNVQRLSGKRSYIAGVIGFILLVISVVYGLYYATAKINYVWRWYKVPQYIVYHHTENINSEIEGSVKKIEKNSDHLSITIGSNTEKEVFQIPIEGEVIVELGDNIYVGDTLGSFKEWRTGMFIQALWMTLKISIISTVIGILIGIFCGIARISSNPFFKWTAATYVEFVRGSPLLVQIFIWYFVIGSIVTKLLRYYDLPDVGPFWYGVAALSFFTGAYVGEIVRSGIQSIDKGQTEAARSLGMSYFQCMSYIVLPQALRRILPPLAGQFINLIKDSSLLGAISLRELTQGTREVVSTNLQFIELWTMCAVLYLTLTFTLSMFLQYLERRNAI